MGFEFWCRSAVVVVVICCLVGSYGLGRQSLVLGLERWLWFVSMGLCGKWMSFLFLFVVSSGWFCARF